MANKPKCMVDGKVIMGDVGTVPYLVGKDLKYCANKHTKKQLMEAVSKHSRQK